MHLKSLLTYSGKDDGRLLLLKRDVEVPREGRLRRALEITGRETF
jgi:hypothetical protein